jgi:replicative DNA helicase
LIIVAARPGVGKTSLALNVSLHAALIEERKVAIISMEMGKSQLFQRALGQLTDTNMRSRHDLQSNFDEISKAADRLRSAPIWLTETSSLTVLDIKAIARQQHKTKGLDFLVIDYLQLINATRKSSKENRNQQLSEITRTLKCLAMDLNIPILCLSQLSRKVEQRQDKKPVMSDLRDSGSIEQDADLVIFIYRPDYYGSKEVDDQGLAEINIAKQRNGQTAIEYLGFKDKTCNFYTRR